jgi:hypothetical protein
MNIDNLQTYQDVVKYLKKQKRTKHLLLGNGFSMAYDAQIFSYNALSTFIENSKDELLKQLFKSINTKNFEVIMQQLDLFVDVAKVFKADKSLIDKIQQTSENLKNNLINAVQVMHPEHVFKIPEEKSLACCAFLEDYLANEGRVFSSNYDLLLYWVLMRNTSQNAGDGFGRELENPLEDGKYVPDYEPEFSELRWGKHKDSQSVFYLHGALPLFDAGIDIIKEEYNGDYLLDNIKARMEKKEYPIFVTAGNAIEKLIHIMHNRYLSFCYDTLSSITGSLITFGFNFGDNDTHIIDAINKAAQQPISDRLRSIYIGVYSDNDYAHIKKIEKKFNCPVRMYNARTANVWQMPV